MGDFVTYVAKEWNVIWQAPVTFIAATIVAGGIIWAAMEFRYRSVLESLNERIRLRDDQIAQFREKIGTASPDEIKARIDQLEAQVQGLVPPRLRMEQKDTLTNLLRRQTGNCVICHDVAAAAMRPFAGDIIKCFRDAGWTITTPVVVGPGMQPPHGVGIRVPDANNLTALQDMVLKAFQAIQIDFDLESGQAHPMHLGPPGQGQQLMSDLFIMVTTKFA